ncbi:MAG: hypothetical protein M1334_03335 [Patescibacteria group bacterium]|nr:hypothetical protein [Patescibacteria group bacterium]
MTIIKFNKNKNFYLRVLIIFLPIIIIETVGLISLYSQTVVINYNAAQTKAELQSVQAREAEANNQIFGLFASQNVVNFSQSHDLAIDNQPQYLETNSKWAFASQY